MVTPSDFHRNELAFKGCDGAKRATEFHISHNKSLPENEESPNLGQVAALELSPLRNSDHTCLLSISLGFPFGQDSCRKSVQVLQRTQHLFLRPEWNVGECGNWLDFPARSSRLCKNWTPWRPKGLFLERKQGALLARTRDQDKVMPNSSMVTCWLCKCKQCIALEIRWRHMRSQHIRIGLLLILNKESQGAGNGQF
uniref:HDC13314 n=1 Tax=Drosophila melanogaster TaxID=7227 RepID=Q6IK60_DROME|nr:TPA_inf: HDC13314 [Drosophila melanogaster]